VYIMDVDSHYSAYNLYTMDALMGAHLLIICASRGGMLIERALSEVPRLRLHDDVHHQVVVGSPICVFVQAKR
jgi:hypothetical protein